MNYRLSDTRLSSSGNATSDSDDDDDTFWKRRKSELGKRKSITHMVVEDPAPCENNKRSRNKKVDDVRGVESYLVRSSESENEIDADVDSNEFPKAAKRTLDHRIYTCRQWNESINREHVGVDFDSPPELVKQVLVQLLNEPNEQLLGQVVDVLGVKRSLEFYYLTEDVNNAGGLYFADGSKRRSQGGVFLTLIKASDKVSDAERKEMFTLSRQLRDRAKRKYRHAKRALLRRLATSEDSTTLPAPSEERSAEQEMDNNPDDSIIEPTSVNVTEEGELPSVSSEASSSSDSSSPDSSKDQ